LFTESILIHENTLKITNPELWTPKSPLNFISGF
jgi:hypothetical protein